MRKRHLTKFHLFMGGNAFIIGVSALLCGCSISGTKGPPPFEIVRSSFAGSAWGEGHAEASVISQDGGASYAVPGGSLWWFGDTFKGVRDAAGKPHFSGGVSCSVAFLDAKDKSSPPRLAFFKGQDGVVAQAIPFLPEEPWSRFRIWPQHGCRVNGKSYIYYSLIEIIGTGAWDFKGAGSGLARSTQPLGVHERVRAADGDWHFPVEPTAIVAADGWLYLYDVGKRGRIQGVWLARVRPADIENPAAYEFQCATGDAFSSDKARQIPLLENVYGQVSVVWNAALGKYVMATSSDLSHPREIRLLAADSPLGPWSGAAVSLDVPETRQGKKTTLVYCAYLHPELFKDGGRVMRLTFSLHLKDSNFDANNELLEIECAPPGH